MSIERLRKKSQAFLTFCFWVSVVPAAVAAIFCLLSMGREAPPSGPLMFFGVFVAQLVVVSMCYQNKLARALLAEIDALRGQLSQSEGGSGERFSGSGRPTA